MAKKAPKALTAEQVAQRAKPKWKVVPAPSAGLDSDSYVTAKPDAQTPEGDALYRKYFGASNHAKPAKKKAPPKKSALVRMEPKDASDARRLGPKTRLVEDGVVTGEQG